ncbi:MAG: hypothetical protein JW839_22250 [Candidatus Lokiarchaeota archaeon]|nr:hypothetical protein [Candidatus Lokiarchaeota archaeon]
MVDRIDETNKTDKSKPKKAVVRRGDLFDHDLGRYDFIFTYTLPGVQRFLKHVFATARPGAVVFSYKYPLDQLGALLQLRHEEGVEVDGKGRSLFFYVRG